MNKSTCFAASASWRRHNRLFGARGILLAQCLAALVSCTASAICAAADERARVALVLSGGGARGLAHVGVLEVLERLRVPVDCIVGTSMGALVGGSYAAGVPPARMRSVLHETDIEALFEDQPPRAQIPQRVKRDDYKSLFEFTLGFNDGKIQLPAGVSAGYKFELFLKDLVGPGASVAGLDFDQLPTPYRAVATDLESGEMKVFARGELTKVMRASMSLPAIVAPAEIDGHIYVDGGLVRNLPVDIGRELCGEVIIAVNLGTPLQKRDQLISVIDVAKQSINLLTEQNVKQSLAELDDGDILIEPDLEGFSSSDFSSAREIIKRGVQAAQRSVATLSRLSLDQDAYLAWSQSRDQKRLAEQQVVAVSVQPGERFSAQVIERDVAFEQGEPVRTEDLHRDLERVYGRADFSYLGYSIVPGEDGATIIIDAEAKPWGPGYVKFGLNTRSDFDSPSQSNLAASYRRTWANRLGAEWRVDAQVGYNSFLNSEFLQPLQLRDGAFIAPHIDLRRTFVQFYEADLRIGEFRINSQQLGLDFGLTGKVGELRLGPYIASTQGDPDFGALTPVLPPEDLTQIGLSVAGIVDQLDSITFPTAGWLAAFNVRTTQEDWNADAEYTRAQVILRGVKTFGANTFAARVEWGEELHGDLPVYESFQLGGPLRVSGLFLDQLTGTRYNLGTLAYYRRYADLPPQLGRGLYLGLSLEGGRIDDPLMRDPSDWVSAGSIFWGADTVLGAVYVGYGYSSLGQASGYLMIGPQF